MPAAVGWEPNARGKPGARMADLGPTMDPKQLVESAVDLNLRLMRWRAAPALDTARLAATRCLLLGAGAFQLVLPRCICAIGQQFITHPHACDEENSWPEASTYLRAF